MGVDRAAAEADARDVPLPDGTEADDEPPRAGRLAGLVRVPDDRGVEERGAFEGVFLGEYEPMSSRRDSLTGRSVSR
jgi:hypothetical protein